MSCSLGGANSIIREIHQGPEWLTFVICFPHTLVWKIKIDTCQTFHLVVKEKKVLANTPG